MSEKKEDSKRDFSLMIYHIISSTLRAHQIVKLRSRKLIPYLTLLDNNERTSPLHTGLIDKLKKLVCQNYHSNAQEAAPQKTQCVCLV